MLSGLGSYTDVTVSGNLSPAQIRTSLDEQKLRNLELRHGSVTDLGSCLRTHVTSPCRQNSRH